MMPTRDDEFIRHDELEIHHLNGLGQYLEFQRHKWHGMLMDEICSSGLLVPEAKCHFIVRQKLEFVKFDKPWIILVLESFLVKNVLCQALLVGP